MTAIGKTKAKGASPKKTKKKTRRTMVQRVHRLMTKYLKKGDDLKKAKAKTALSLGLKPATVSEYYWRARFPEKYAAIQERARAKKSKAKEQPKEEVDPPEATIEVTV